jgi:protoporphyrinogen oxidase
MAAKLSSEAGIREAAGKIKWRGLKLVYLHIKGEPGIEGETFYFPELKYVFGRVSVPKRFSGSMQPESGYTCLTCEIPCSENDNLWKMPEKEICGLCLHDLRKAELITRTQAHLPGKSFVVDLPKVYPVYVPGWENVFRHLLTYLGDNFPDIYVSGKPGFFMHCNLDHAIDTGLFLAEHLMENKPAKEWYSRAASFQNLKLRD